TVADPFVEVAERPRRLGQPVVATPAEQVRAQSLYYLFHALATVAPGQLAHLLFQSLQGLRRDSAANRFTGREPEREPQKLVSHHRSYATLGRVDLEPQTAKEPLQQAHHALPSAFRADVHIQVVRIAGKLMSSPLQLLIHLVQQDVRE